MGWMRCRYASGNFSRALSRMEKALSPQRLDKKVAKKCADIVKARLVRRTPKRWTGQLRRNWRTVQWSTGIWVVENPSPVMSYLEHGTRPHGARGFRHTSTGKRVRKKLFIPLNRQTAMAYSAQGGTLESKRELFRNGRFITTTRRNRRGIRQQRTTQKKLIYGKDYILAKRVKGIRAKHIVEGMRPFARKLLRIEMRRYLRKAVLGRV